MDANSGEPWSEMDISDLTNEIAHGRTMAKPLVSSAGTRRGAPEGQGVAVGRTARKRVS
jgi:hypothetical protein